MPYPNLKFRTYTRYEIFSKDQYEAPKKWGDIRIASLFPFFEITWIFLDKRYLPEAAFV